MSRTSSREIWQEPVRGSYGDPTALRRSGLERFSPDVMRVPPPIHYLTGLTPMGAELGSVTFDLPITPWLQGPVAGLVSSGVLAVAADAPLSGAINSTAGPGVIATTSQLSLNFVAPATTRNHKLTARGQTIHVGRRQGLSEARVEDETGRLLAHCTTRCVLLDLGLPPEDAAPAPGPTRAEVEAGWTPPYQRPIQGSPLPAETWHRLSGLEIVNAIIDGDLPRAPLGSLTGIRVEEASEGRATATMPCTGWLNPPAPNIYGGAIALFADIALANALLTTVPAGGSYATLDLAVYFIRPVLPDGRLLTARAMVVHRGRNFAVASVTLVNEDGKTVATATTSAMTLDRPFEFEAPPEPADEGPA